MSTAQKTKSGTFQAMLQRNNKQLREDRALEIAEDLEIAYSRRIEDREKEIKAIDRKMNRMLDITGDNIQTRMSSKDFEAEAFLDVREALIKDRAGSELILDRLKEDYNALFEDSSNASAEAGQ